MADAVLRVPGGMVERTGGQQDRRLGLLPAPPHPARAAQGAGLGPPREGALRRGLGLQPAVEVLQQLRPCGGTSVEARQSGRSALLHLRGDGQQGRGVRRVLHG